MKTRQEIKHTQDYYSKKYKEFQRVVRQERAKGRNLRPQVADISKRAFTEAFKAYEYDAARNNQKPKALANITKAMYNIKGKQQKTFAKAYELKAIETVKQELLKQGINLKSSYAKRTINLARAKAQKKDIQTLNKEEITKLGKFIDETEQSGVYGGDYE